MAEGSRRDPVDSPSDAIARPGGRRHRTARWAALGVAVALIPLGLIMGSQLQADPTYRGGHLLGKPVPVFDLPTVAGTRVSSGALAGRSVIVNFWNTWCVPCIEEHPALRAFYAAHAHDPDFAMVGIVRQDTDAAVRRWVADKRDAWTIAFDPGARAAVDFATSGQPETFAISPAGVVVAYQYGASTVAGLEAMLTRARTTK